MKQRIVLFAALLVVTAGSAWGVVATRSSDDTLQRTAKQSPTATAGASKKPGDATPASPSSDATKPGDTSAQTSKTSADTGCKLLPLAAAQQLLGSGVHSLAAKTTMPQTADTVLTTCAYTADSGTVQINQRSPKNSLGTSENATPFGSERPGGASSISGYGQSAYWNPADSTLNVLSDNSWYVIARSAGGQSSSQADTEAAAKLVEPKL
jgi:hypothetical protein